MHDNDTIITETKNWITNVVVKCNFCPFAAREVQRGSIHYEVQPDADLNQVLQYVANIFEKLNAEARIETALLILPNGYAGFEPYLELVELAQELLENEGYEGVYQLASFHPAYLFAGTSESDPSNYTNRSPYPMLHFLREESVSLAIDSHPQIESVPENNIRFTQEKGIQFMKELLASCHGKQS